MSYVLITYPETEKELDEWLTRLYQSSFTTTHLVLRYTDKDTFQQHIQLLKEGGYHFHIPCRDWNWEHYTITVEK